jgi:hypothetical protein
MSPIKREDQHGQEPTNADLARLIASNHAETVRRLGEQDERFGVLEHHLVDPKKPERTLPIRVRELERSVKVVRWGVGLVIGSALSAAGTWAWGWVTGNHRNG